MLYVVLRLYFADESSAALVAIYYVTMCVCKLCIVHCKYRNSVSVSTMYLDISRWLLERNLMEYKTKALGVLLFSNTFIVKLSVICAGFNSKSGSNGIIFH